MLEREGVGHCTRLHFSVNLTALYKIKYYFIQIFIKYSKQNKMKQKPSLLSLQGSLCLTLSCGQLPSPGLGADRLAIFLPFCVFLAYCLVRCRRLTSPEDGHGSFHLSAWFLPDFQNHSVSNCHCHIVS